MSSSAHEHFSSRRILLILGPSQAAVNVDSASGFINLWPGWSLEILRPVPEFISSLSRGPDLSILSPGMDFIKLESSSGFINLWPGWSLEILSPCPEFINSLGRGPDLSVL